MRELKDEELKLVVFGVASPPGGGHTSGDDAIRRMMGGESAAPNPTGTYFVDPEEDPEDEDPDCENSIDPHMQDEDIDPEDPTQQGQEYDTFDHAQLCLDVSDLTSIMPALQSTLLNAACSVLTPNLLKAYIIGEFNTAILDHYNKTNDEALAEKMRQLLSQGKYAELNELLLHSREALQEEEGEDLMDADDDDMEEDHDLEEEGEGEEVDDRND